MLDPVDLLLLCSLKLVLRRLSGGLGSVINRRRFNVDVFDWSRLERLLRHLRLIRLLSVQTEPSASIQGQRDPAKRLRHLLLWVQVQLSDATTLCSRSGERRLDEALLAQCHCHH